VRVRGRSRDRGWDNRLFLRTMWKSDRFGRMRTALGGRLGDCVWARKKGNEMVAKGLNCQRDCMVWSAAGSCGCGLIICCLCHL